MDWAVVGSEKEQVHGHAWFNINKKTRKVCNLAAEKYHSLFHDEVKEKEYNRKLLNAFGNKFAPRI